MADRRIHPALFHMRMAELVAKRSTCLRREVGSLAVKDNRMIASGRNGNVPGVPHCTVCLRDTLNIKSGTEVAICHAIHAEINMLTQSSLFGVPVKASTIYVTHMPCFTCVKALASVFPLAIIYKNDYPDPLTDKFLQESGWRKSSQTIEGETLFILKPPSSDCLPLNSLYRGEVS